MPKQQFALRPGEAKSVEIEWRGLWKDIRVRHEGRELGVIPDQKALKAGAEFSLPDGGTLGVKLVTGFHTELQVTRDGKPLPGSGSDPTQRLAQSAGAVWVVAGLSLVVGLVAVLGEVRFLLDLGIGWTSVAFGAVFAVLAWLTGRRSMIALGLAVGLFAADSVLNIVALMEMPRPNFGWIFMRVILIAAMARGFSAIRALKARDAAVASIQAF